MVDALSSLHKESSETQNEDSQDGRESKPPDTSTTQTDRHTRNLASDEHANIWRWITSKPDVSVGKDRKWNHLSLQQVLELPEAPRDEGSSELDDDTATAPQPVAVGLPAYRPRLYVTESKMWECITGHGIDYQKLPKFEWLALLGIASVMEKGILQGDLTRLVGQDKRSLPKRTDVLARKGYIEKKPILTRGCKTSKLWLKCFSPSAPTQNKPAETSSEVVNDAFPRAALVTDLEPVPWRDHWTGNTIDYAMLGRTIMAVIKEFGVIRYGDLRAKLGVAGVHWQMKVVTRTCRFFIELGLIEYVTASLGNRLYRDCLKFKRNLTTDDLSAFISGGGSVFRFGNNYEPKKVSTKRHEDDTVGGTPTDRWNPDKPLTISILETILASGEEGITNKGLAFNTIGGHLERHVSAVSTAVSVKNSQPAHLRHLQARKEHCRTGRVAAYRFFPDAPTSERPQLHPRDDINNPELPERGNDYGFRAVDLKPRTRQVKVPNIGNGPEKRPREAEVNDSQKRRKTDVTNDVSEGVRVEDSQEQSEPRDHEPTREEQEVIVARTPTGAAQVPKKGKRGRGRKSAPDGDNYNPSAKSKGAKWVCEKCGGTWKNDIGLKYHLTKSQTSCNPAYVENPQPRASRKPRGARSRQAPRAIYRLGECKVLEQRKWKGDTTLETRQSLQRSAVDDAPSDSMDTSQDHNQNRPKETTLYPAVSIGGFVESPLAKLRDVTTVSSTPSSKPDDYGNERRHRSLKPSPLTQPTSLRQTTPQDTAISTSRASTNVALEEPGEEMHRTPLSHKGDADGPPTPIESVYPDPDLDMKVENSDMAGGVAAVEEVAPFEPSATLKDSIAVGEALDILRVKEIVEYLLRSNGGAFPARVSLWHAVLIVWHKAFPTDPIPSYVVNQRAVRELVKKKKVTENMFAFRNSAGAISDCFLLVEHGTDPNLPKFQELKASMKSAHPKPYIPPPFAHATTGLSLSDSYEVPQWASGRGKPVTSIEVLDAPVYIHQATQGRKPVADADNTNEEGGELHAKSVASLARGPYKPGRAFKQASASQWPPAVTEWRPATMPSDGVMFLKPNTHLLEEGIPIDPALDASASTTARGLAGPSMHDVDGQTHSEYQAPRNIRFMENAEIRQRDDEWPDLEDEFFEAGEGSFTVVGSTQHGDTSAENHHQHKTWVSSEMGPSGPVFGPYMDQAPTDSLVATPVRPVTARGSAPRGRPRIRRGQYLPRPRLPERTLTRIGDVEGDSPSSSIVPPISLGDFTVDEALTVAFVAIRMLLGGSNKVIDWGLIKKLFPDQSIDDLRRFWVRLSKERVHFLASFTEKFQDEFLSAYENDELPPLDYDNILGYDWQQLIEWGVALRRTNFVKLPVRRSRYAGKTMQRNFVLQDHPEQPRHWHERFFHYQASVFTRFELATSEAAAIRISSEEPPRTATPDAEPTLVEEAISWVRALCCTSTDKCSPEVVKNKLMTLSEDPSRVNKVLDDAVNNLNNRRIITKRIRARPYTLSRPFQTNLAKFGQEKKFRGASEFKALLDETFRRGEALKVPFLADDGAQMAIMNLHAAGRIAIDGSDIPKVPLGFRPGNYESRKMPKSHLLFDLYARPTESYLYDEDIEILKRAGEKPPPTEAPGRLLPFWLDLFGDANPEMWVKLLGLVCFMLGIRGSMPMPMLALQTRSYLEDYDLRLLIGWCKDVGLVVEDPETGGLRVTEWWWLVVGRQREWGDEVEVEPPKEVVRSRGRPRRRRGTTEKGVAGGLFAAMEAVS